MGPDVPRDGAELRGERTAASVKRARRTAVCFGVAVLGALVYLGGCSNPYGSDSTSEQPSTEQRDSGAVAEPDGATKKEDASALEDASTDAEVDAGKDGDVDAGPCSGKPNGHRWGNVDSQRCCAGQPVSLNTTSNCGACGIVCAAGRTCEQESGHWLCKGCTTDAECRQSVGSNATCYLSYCNCQGTCLGGAQCFVVTGHNYCAYPP